MQSFVYKKHSGRASSVKSDNIYSFIVHYRSNCLNLPHFSKDVSDFVIYLQLFVWTTALCCPCYNSHTFLLASGWTPQSHMQGCKVLECGPGNSLHHEGGRSVSSVEGACPCPSSLCCIWCCTGNMSL